MLSSPSPNPLAWLTVFVALTIGATFANSRHLLDVPRSVAAQALAPLQTGASRLGHAIAGAASGWQELSRLRRENEALRRTVEELLQETVRLRSAELENRELREQLRYAEGHRADAPLPAEVIGFDSSTLLGYAIVNRGSDAHLEDGMTVLTPAGLVGRIVSHTPRTSTVLLINHPSSAVNAVIQGSPGATGLVVGRPDGRLLMRYIPQAETVRVNDLVVTSGLGGAFPRSVPIGRVVHFETRDIDMFQEVIVEPFVDFRKLGHVLVMTGFTPTKL
ncbi:MAG: rod shape-determining protein MreC [Chloroflexi bacterium]|nr:rod shape-determining protein MreC [Chloroflexota bacterium]